MSNHWLVYLLYYTRVDVDAVVPACTSVAAVVPPVVASVVVPAVSPPDEDDVPADPKLKTNPSGVELLTDAE